MTKKVTDNQHTTKETHISQQKQLFDFAPFAVENMSDGVYLISNDARIVYVNSAACKQLGYTEEELLSMRIMDIDPHVTEEKWGSIRGVTVREKIQTIETEHRTKDGRLLPVEVVANYIVLDGKQYSCAFARDITDRKKAEEALGRYQVLVESSRDIILFIRRSDGKILEANRAAAQTYGYTRNELLGMNIRTLRLPEEQSLVSEQIRQADDSGLLLETRHVRKDGSLIPVEISARGITAKGERILLSIIRDISERKLADAERYETLARFSGFAEASQYGMGMAELDGHIVYVNPTLVTMLGEKSEDACRGKHFPTAYYPLLMTQKLQEEVMPILMREGHWHGELELRTADGRRIPTEENYFVIRDEHGKPRYLADILTDITERKRAEEALKISEEKYRLLFENASDAIFVAQDEKLIFPNPQLSRLLGYSYEELNGSPFRNFIHPDDVDMVVDRHKKRLKGDTVPGTYSFRAVTKSGEILWVEVSKVLITWEGRPATLSFLRNITQQKKMEEQLINSQKMEAIGTLAGGVAHDFNNLLTGIIGYTALMLMETDKSHPFYKKLKIIEQLVGSGTELTKQLLGFARCGKYEVRPVNVNDLIINTSDVFGRTKKEITIHKKLQEDLHTAEADSGQIERVLMNLFVNAWQAMPSGGNLLLETQNVILDEQQCRAYDAKPGPYIKISVTDTGVGMDAETQKRIFEPFFTTKGVGKGTGLGLASAYGIIKNHGGFINVYSEKGHGTTFTLYLPVSMGKAAETKPPEDVLLTGEETILVVDDEKVNIEMIKELLEKLGYKVLKAQSGKKAIELYRKHSKDIQLVMLDMIMPEMNGKETFIKLIEIDKNVCVLLASGYSINGEAKTIIDLGCKGFIQKPFRIEELSQKIREVLDR
jgi:two-component system, cell cycle sensor histidine kinase and response regulator CckA